MAVTRSLVSPPGVAVPDAEQVRRRRLHPRNSDALLLILLTAVGAAIRAVVAHQSIYADELSTYWISVRHSLGGVLSLLYSTGRIQHAEITPPLSFLATWLSTRLGSSPELLRLPALLAGTATIPLVYLVGIRTVGRRAALLAATLTVLSPFMIYYSAEARAYGLLMFLVLCAVLSLLYALETGRRRYWVWFAVLSAAAFYTHYTCVFVLATALLWALWTHPEARRRALLATAGAALLIVPWIPGLIADSKSPTIRILSELARFTPGQIRVDIEHWAVGYPYAQSAVVRAINTGVRQLPGDPALVLLACAAVLSLGGLIARARRRDWSSWRRYLRAPGDSAPSRIVLIVGLALASLAGEMLFSAFGDHILGVRDLAASWPFLALACSACAFAGGGRLGLIVSGMVIVAFALATAIMLQPRFQRPDYQSAARFVAAQARPGDVVIDETGGVSPGPLTGFDVAFHGHNTVVRALAPVERDHPWTLFDPKVTRAQAVRTAVAEAKGRRVFVVGGQLNQLRFPRPYRLVSVKSYPGIATTQVGEFSAAGAGQ